LPKKRVKPATPKVARLIAVLVDGLDGLSATKNVAVVFKLDHEQSALSH